MKKLILIFLFLFPLQANAGEIIDHLYTSTPNWSASDKAVFGAGFIFSLMDWSETLQIADNPDRWHETNPIMGRNPSRGTVNTYFATGIAVQLLVLYFAPPDWRRYILGGNAAVEGSMVIQNMSNGIRAF
jgi:hypothetical protein